VQWADGGENENETRDDPGCPKNALSGEAAAARAGLGGRVFIDGTTHLFIIVDYYYYCFLFFLLSLL
jgi:hypothetical protein